MSEKSKTSDKKQKDPKTSSKQVKSKETKTKKDTKAKEKSPKTAKTQKLQKEPKQPKQPKQKKKLKIIPLGGLLEIGKNMTAIEYGNDLIIIDVLVAAVGVFTIIKKSWILEKMPVICKEYSKPKWLTVLSRILAFLYVWIAEYFLGALLMSSVKAQDNQFQRRMRTSPRSSFYPSRRSSASSLWFPISSLERPLITSPTTSSASFRSTT